MPYWCLGRFHSVSPATAGSKLGYNMKHSLPGHLDGHCGRPASTQHIFDTEPNINPFYRVFISSQYHEQIFT
jgi:hypothetical protein